MLTFNFQPPTSNSQIWELGLGSWELRIGNKCHLPTSNLQLPKSGVGSWELGVGKNWALGVGGWELLELIRES
jgi:hypothetical protein